MKIERLTQIVSYAYQNVRFYKRMMDENGIDPLSIEDYDSLRKLPFLHKDDIQAQPEDFISDEYKKFPKTKDIVLRRTSGSTGKYLKIYWDYKDDIKSLFSLWNYRNRYYGVGPSDKFCGFYTASYQGNKIVEQQMVQRSLDGRHLGFCKINLTYERLRDCYEQICSFDPKWLNLQPSIADLLAEIVNKEHLALPSSLSYIELSGEYLFDDVRKRIEQTFQVPVANQYGCNEANAIAFECREGHMHCLTDNVLVEVIKDGVPVFNEEGDIYITSLSNYAMPFLRYQMGDRGILVRDCQCPCGSKRPELIVKSGRTSDYISLPNAEQINAYVLIGIIEYTNEYMGAPIKQFQITQTDVGCFTVKLVLKKEFSTWQSGVKENFLLNIQEQKLKDAKWDFQFVDCILPDPQTGKFKFFINQCKEGK